MLAPVLRERPAAAYAAARALVLLVIAWGSIPATRKVIPVLVMAALVALGIAALRRQTAEEFPDGHAGDGLRALRTPAAHAWTSRGGGPPAGDGVPPAAVGGRDGGSGDGAPGT